ncbi:MAG TPA: glycosyltransferase family 4 protein [Chloroflexota bacterium]|nr:glycosyltransferase family 4 protein [Chloroflexota bacterium]
MVDPNANTPPYDRALVQALARAGCRVELLTSRFLYEDLPRPAAVTLDECFFRLAGSGFADRLSLTHRPAARRALKAAEYPLDWLLTVPRIARRPPDVVHVQWSVQPTLDLLLWRVLRRLRIPIVYTAHNLVPHHAGSTDAARYGQLYRAADAVVVHSERSAHALHTTWGVHADRIAIVPHGPLLEAHPPIERAAARQQLGLPQNAELVLFAGLIEPYKGLADLIAAFGTLAARRPLARIVVAGKPNEPFATYQHQLAALGLLDRATLNLRFLPEPVLAAYLSAADVVVLPYRATTSSGLLFAARRFGRPIVATDVGDLGVVILDGETGLLVPPENPARLGAAVERLLADPALADRLGAAGQRAALGPETWTEAARRTVALYRRILTEPPGVQQAAPLR